jgi:hypothetical protein
MQLQIQLLYKVAVSMRCQPQRPQQRMLAVSVLMLLLVKKLAALTGKYAASAGPTWTVSFVVS